MTTAGKLIASGAIISGVLVLALPITIIVDNFMKVTSEYVFFLLEYYLLIITFFTVSIKILYVTQTDTHHQLIILLEFNFLMTERGIK